MVGRSGAGKTTLILGLIRLLQRDGITVAAIKHHHGVLSPPGKDSARLFAAGAPTVLLAADGILEMAQAPTLADAKRRLGPDLTLLLVEGIKEYPGAKIWVGEGCPQAVPGLLAVVGGVGPPGLKTIAQRDPELVYQEVVRPFLGREGDE